MLFRRRAPLLRGALVAGTGYLAGRNAARQQEGEAEQDAQLAQLRAQQDRMAAAPPAPATPAGGNVVDELARLGSLRTQGLITDAEFAAAKAKLLG